MAGLVGVTGLTYPVTLAAQAQPTPPTAKNVTVGAAAKAEPKSESVKAAESTVQSEVEKGAADKRAQLLKDAQSALDESHNAVQALADGKKAEALAALEKVTGKLDLIVARDPALALAPVGVSTVIRDVYASPDTARETVTKAREYLSAGKVQEARVLLGALASEAEVQVTNIPLATYPAAIKAVVPLIDAGKLEEARTALATALSTLVIESYVTPLPKIRAQAILADAEKLAEKSGRTTEESKQLHAKVEAARDQLKLGEVLGYGSKDDYKPLYVQLDDIQRKTKGDNSGKGIFDQIKESLRTFKDRLL